LSCYGRPDYKTPVLDRLATQGLKFTSNYAAAPVCTPTRCGFITGRYPQRRAVGLEEPLTRRSPQVGLPPGHATIGTQLQAAGYATALIGKWHLGWQPEFNPVRHGFDEFFGILSGAVDYFTHAAADRAQTEGGAPAPDLWENETPVERSGYLTDLLTNRAIDLRSTGNGRMPTPSRSSGRGTSSPGSARLTTRTSWPRAASRRACSQSMRSPPPAG